jgi:hypothetical protein
LHADNQGFASLQAVADGQTRLTIGGDLPGIETEDLSTGPAGFVGRGVDE